MNKLALLSLSVLALTGCMGTRQLSSNITEHGTIDNKDDIVFPQLDKAWQKNGQFPNSENLSKIRPGVAKDELYQLIGRPHFNEANRAREWDYIMKFYQADNSVKICQYKVIFDDKFKGQEFYWMPADCANYAKPALNTTAVATPVITQAPIIKEKITLEADALFKFDKWKLEDMLPEGRAKLDELAAKLIAWEARGDSRVNLTGHTDRYGDDMYNMNLSMLRAQTVRQYLISKGVTSSMLTASGAGRTQPLPHVICDVNAPRAEQIKCLQPNRRVEADVTVYAFANDGSRHEIRQGETYQNFNDGQ
ncbi:OmpA family protein [Moraxella bovis]|uniref:Outer membrane protein II n=1 Tax=Moraxella bovis TaxID=476 RepID=A0A378Q4M9_MORBO|nr:OmpA family protein [Moraxella bovis]STY94137.1 Outer membrane protein II [Moraxella bovis]